MSTYYSYYIGYKKDKKFYPLGPFDAFGRLCPVVCRSQSFASDLHSDLNGMRKEERSEELIKALSLDNETEEDSMWSMPVKYLPIEALPTESYIRKGYFLISDIAEYEKNGCIDESGELFYDWMSPIEYAAKYQNHVKGLNKYSFYAFEDTSTKEYEAFLIRQAAYMFEFSFSHKEKDKIQLVTIETEG